MVDEETSDSELLREWLAHGEDRAFHELVERYAGLVHAAAKRTCGCDSMAAEASQLTFIALARKAKRLTSRKSLVGWLHISAVMHSKNLLRKRQREAQKIERLRQDMETRPQLENSVDWKRMQPVLDESLAALSSNDREALLLRFYRSMSVREVATTLGIATDAAQKRLNRATRRLRVQMSRRGCQTGDSFAAVMAAGFGTDATSLIPTSSAIAAKAISVGAVGGATSLTTLGIIMTHKTAIATGAVLLITGAGAVAFMNRNSVTPSATNSPPARMSDARQDTSVGRAPGNSSLIPKRTRKKREESGFASLYGESRANLAKQVTTNVISVMEDAASMREMTISGEMGAVLGGPDAMLRRELGTLDKSLKLTETQRDEVKLLLADFQKRKLEKSRSAISQLKKNPTPLMELMLASDAMTRGEIDESDFESIRSSTAGQLGGIQNPLDRESFRGGRMLQDDSFVTEFRSILDGDQVETLEVSLNEKAIKEGDSTPNRDISGMQPIGLEDLDATISSVKKMTTGIKSMMEGMGGLQDLGPMLEMQNQNR